MASMQGTFCEMFLWHKSIHWIDKTVSELKWKDTEAAAEAATAAAPERCTMPPAQSAERHVKFPSSLMDPGPYIAANATRSISQQDPAPGHREDTK
jgi:hypothetical protein